MLRMRRKAILASVAVMAAALVAYTVVKTEYGTSTTPMSLSDDASICNNYCDERDPAQAAGDRQPVRTTLYSRQIVLHFDDTSAMGWASIDNGSTGDEVWLDRSFDGGRNWSGRLGNTQIPQDNRGWRTQMYNVDDWAKHGVGALRACGKAGDRVEMACTPWARTTWNAGEKRTAAVTALMQFYNNDTGLFETTGWWNSANALTAVIDNIRVTGMESYKYAIDNTFVRGANKYKDFVNEFMDDTGWWGLAWVDAYDLTRDPKYLDMAKIDADYMAGYWDGVCNGGIWWSAEKKVKNAIANSLYLQLNAALHNRIPGDTQYQQRARDELSWFLGTGMINSRFLVVDGIDLTTCQGATSGGSSAVWSYNQGVLLAGLVEYAKATGESQSTASGLETEATEPVGTLETAANIKKALDTQASVSPISILNFARTLANGSTADAGLNPAGILTELCESGDCGADGAAFKGIYVRDLARLNAELADHPYSPYLSRQIDSAYAKDRNEMDAYGVHWVGPIDSIDAARQQSAVDLMNCA